MNFYLNSNRVLKRIDAIIGAWLCDIGFFISCIVWMNDGFGDHLWNVSLAQLVQYAEVSILFVMKSCNELTSSTELNICHNTVLLGAYAY